MELIWLFDFTVLGGPLAVNGMYMFVVWFRGSSGVQLHVDLGFIWWMCISDSFGGCGFRVNKNVSKVVVDISKIFLCT